VPLEVDFEFLLVELRVCELGLVDEDLGLLLGALIEISMGCLDVLEVDLDEDFLRVVGAN
jgi:hypothetical protein